MIWATVSSRSCFCWLCRTSPSLATKSIFSLISELTTLWCPCVEVISCAFGRECSLWSVSSLCKALLTFALLPFILQGQACLSLRVSLDFLLHSSPLWWKGYLFWVLVLGLVGLHRTVQLQLLWHQCLGHRFGLLWYWTVWLGSELR